MSKLVNVVNESEMSEAKKALVLKVDNYIHREGEVQIGGIRLNLQCGASIEGVVVFNISDWKDKSQPCPSMIIPKFGSHASMWATVLKRYGLKKSEVIIGQSE